MSTEKLRIGIIGMGLFAATSHVPDLRGTGRAEVVAAARRSADRLAMAKRELDIPATYTDWREMLAQERLDAVVVSTPHDQHVEPTVAALERGLHVLLEKPLATSVADAQTILRAAQRSDRVVMMGVNRRGDPGWRTAQRSLAAGDIGRMRQISVVMCGDLRVFREVGPLAPELQQWLDSMSEMNKTYVLDVLKPTSWRQDAQQMGGNMLADTGSHTVDVMFWLAGASAVEVMAYSPTDRPRQAAIITLQALLANGVILSMTFNDHVAMGDELHFRGSGQLAVYGDKGMLTAKVPMGGGGGPDDMVIERNGERQPVVVEGETISPSAAFVAAILDGAPNVATVDDAARVVALTQGAYQSAAERRIVRLDEDL